MLDRLTRGGQHAADTHFSIADCFVWPLVEGALEERTYWENENSADGRDDGRALVVAYCRRIRERESVKKVVRKRTGD